jgi:hypothetical protein
MASLIYSPSIAGVTVGKRQTRSVFLRVRSPLLLKIPSPFRTPNLSIVVWMQEMADQIEPVHSARYWLQKPPNAQKAFAASASLNNDADVCRGGRPIL